MARTGDFFRNEEEDSFRDNCPGLQEDDYYGILNVPKDADLEAITFQYRKLSKIYHPDKHTNPDDKKIAEELFSKVKTAYEVLSDENSRAIYDSVGVKGLEPDRMQVLLRYKTADEIREEFEKLAREREERLLEQKTNPKGSVSVHLNAVELFSPYVVDDEDYFDGPPYVEFQGIHIAQSIETPMSRKNTILLSGNVSAENGRGSGSISLGFRRLLKNTSYVELDLSGTTNGLGFGCKGFTQLGQRCFLNVSGSFQNKVGILRPHLTAALGIQLDEKSLININYRHGGITGLETVFIKDFEKNRLEIGCLLGVPHSYGRLGLTHRMEESEMKAVVKGGTFGAYFEYGMEKKVSKLSTFGAVVSLGIPSGVSLRMKIKRGHQVYLFPIQLCDELIPSPVIYGTIIPWLAFAIIKRFLIDPYEEEKKERDKEKAKVSYQAKMEVKRSEAEAACKLMSETYARVILEEENKNGLVIVKAIFGRLFSKSYAAPRADESIDVTVPLQCLVKSSSLVLFEGSKTQLPGFYDPSPGEEKHLMIRYKFKNTAHSVTIKDEDPVKIPSRNHVERIN